MPPTQVLRRFAVRHPMVFHAARRAKVLGRFVLRRPHEPEFAVFARIGRIGGLFLDVGGNSGQSALSFRLFNRRAPIVTIEPNPGLEPQLRLVRRLIREFRYEMVAAGPMNGEATLYVPRTGRVEITGEASLNPLEAGRLLNGGTAELEEVVVPMRRLDDLGLAPTHVKIDVEADSVGVLEGLSATIDRFRPVVMVETHNPQSGGFTFLTDRGYRPHVVEDGALRPWRPGFSNTVFLPEDEPALAA